MMTHHKVKKTVVLSLALLMSGSCVIKAEGEIVVAPTAVVVKDTTTPSTAPVTEEKKDVAVKAEEKKEEPKKTEKRYTAIYNQTPPTGLNKAVAWLKSLVSKDVAVNKSTPADVRADVMELYGEYPAVLNEFKALWQAQDAKDFVAADAQATRITTLFKVMSSNDGAYSVSSAQNIENLLKKENELEATQARKINLVDVKKQINVTLAKIGVDLLAAAEEEVKSGTVNPIKAQTILAAGTTDINSILHKNVREPMAASKNAAAELTGIRAALGFATKIVKDAMTAGNDTVGTGITPDQSDRAKAAAAVKEKVADATVEVVDATKEADKKAEGEAETK